MTTAGNLLWCWQSIRFFSLFCFESLYNFLPDGRNFTLNCFDMTPNKSLFISSNLKLENLKVFLFDYGIWCKIKSIKMESCKVLPLFFLQTSFFSGTDKFFVPREKKLKSLNLFFELVFRFNFFALYPKLQNRDFLLKWIHREGWKIHEKFQWSLGAL